MKTKKTDKLKIHRLLSVLITVVGIMLLIFMITVEDEPGAIPLLMTVFGSAWYFITRAKIRSLPGRQ